MLEWWKAGTPIAHSSKLIAQSQAKGGGDYPSKTVNFLVQLSGILLYLASGT
jgi:hypothetical protein